MEEEKPPLLDLCPELRNKIYDLVVSSPHGIIVLGNKSVDKAAISAPPPRGALALSQTCRQLRQETLPMLFSCNTVAFDVDYYLNAGEDGAGSKHNGIGTHAKEIADVKSMLEGLRDWLDSVPEDSTRHMRDVCIWLGTVSLNAGDAGVAEKAIEFLYDTWTELQQHVSRLGLSGTRAARFGLYFRLKIERRHRTTEVVDVSLGDRFEERRKAQQACSLDRASLIKVQNEVLASKGMLPLGTLMPEFEKFMMHQESVVQILYD
ncbi:hypothetical protein LTS10_006378 [Elasticomyces elasticus]|nr:hypothetical protein LTS10_006378 [Elasticomyces elasticus]